MEDYKHNFEPYRDPYNALNLILNDDRLRSLKCVVVRWHPNLKTCGPGERQSMERIIKNSPKNVVHIKPSSAVNSYGLLMASDKIVTFGSTIGVEAIYYGKPTILIGRAVYENTNATYIPKDHDEAMRLIVESLPPKSSRGAILYAAWFWNRANVSYEKLRHDNNGRYYLNNIPLIRRDMIRIRRIYYRWIALLRLNFTFRLGRLLNKHE